MLYESFIHPRDDSCRRCRRRGWARCVALEGLRGWSSPLVAFIGIVLLIGIVKKNGIMLVDFAHRRAARAGAVGVGGGAGRRSLERLRPILMTTLAALFGALPLAIATGAGAELRRPLGITIVGGLVLSQILTLYTTPVVYLLMSKLSSKRARVVAPVPAPAE